MKLKKSTGMLATVILLISVFANGIFVFAGDGIVVHEDVNQIKGIFVDLYPEVREFINNIEDPHKRELIRTYHSTPTHTTSSMKEGAAATPVVDQNAIIGEYKKLLELPVEELEKIVDERLAGLKTKAKASAGLKKDNTVFKVD